MHFHVLLFARLTVRRSHLGEIFSHIFVPSLILIESVVSVFLKTIQIHKGKKL